MGPLAVTLLDQCWLQEVSCVGHPRLNMIMSCKLFALLFLSPSFFVYYVYYDDIYMYDIYMYVYIHVYDFHGVNLPLPSV